MKLSSVVILLTLAALCFSVGEGLRLTPFPVSQSVEGDVAGVSQSSVHKYGPLDVPAQAQKRSKRFAIDLSCPVSLYTNEFSARRQPANERHSINVTAVLAVAFPSDRAPPFSI
ncbi:MAG TPA: hypothetical protein VFS90_07840 [Pyrinomonadaceae bacterium]|nr:hypothetical protein [Pyrinomonadaceae bacterium]